MANRAAPALVLGDGDRDRLERLTRSSTVSAGAAQRARIVLLAADGVANDQICELVGCGRQKVLQWRGRYESKGLAGLADQKRPGRPRTIDHAKRHCCIKRSLNRATGNLPVRRV